MSVTTKTGDKGMTSLYTGERVKKNSVRVWSYGTIDEVTSALALARAFAQSPENKELILQLERYNYQAMADLASITDKYYITAETVKVLEDHINRLEEILPPITAFIMPGDSKAGAFLDVVRTTTRRAERRVLDLEDEAEINEQVKIYLNRLSDLAFLMMRLEDNLAAESDDK